jgi:hydrogenase expression/formation protein HypE
MGGVPRWMTVVMLLPEGRTTSATVEALFADLQAAGTAAGVAMIGGHTEITIGLDRPLLIGTMLGTAGSGGLLKPGNANIGDELFVTKWIAIEGTALLANERREELTAAVGGEIVRSAVALLDTPGISIVADAQALLVTDVVTALHDPTEGGLATAVHEMADASGLGAELISADIPMLPQTRAICDHYGVDALGLLSSGALLIAARPGQAHVLEQAATQAGINLARIGTLVDPSAGFTLITEKGTGPLHRFDSDELTRVL